MAYHLSTPISYAVTEEALLRSLEQWGATNITIHCSAPSGRRNNVRDTVDRRSIEWEPGKKRVIVTFNHPSGKFIEVSEERHAAPSDNIRALFLALDSMRLNEKRGFGELLGNAYLQLAAGAETDPFEVLGIKKGLSHVASFEGAKAAFRALSKVHHPDVGGDPLKFRAIQDAYAEIKEAYGG